MTLTVVNLIGYSAMAGATGGGGLGDLAIRYGYQRFDIQVMLLTVSIMILMVQGIQWGGTDLSGGLRRQKLIHSNCSLSMQTLARVGV